MAKKIKKGDDKKITETPKKEDVKFDSLLDILISAYGKDASEENKKLFSTTFTKYLKQELEKNNTASKYNVLVLFDNTVLVKGDSDQIYRAVTGFSDKINPYC